jgi:hypothetical protein
VNIELEELRKQLTSGKINITDTSSVIKKGIINNQQGESFNYEVTHGWNVIEAMNCDTKWGKFNLELFEFIRDQNYSEEELTEVLSKLSIEDNHWDWFAKSMVHRQDEYEWFFLTANGSPQGACVIYHPKTSVIDEENIFYIEYVAAAPWNRDNPYKEKSFSGIGSILINCALDYSVNTLGLVHGFSLHSLPKAKPYYEKIGMITFSDLDKGTLAYYEMPRKMAKDMVEAI